MVRMDANASSAFQWDCVAIVPSFVRLPKYPTVRSVGRSLAAPGGSLRRDYFPPFPRMEKTTSQKGSARRETSHRAQGGLHGRKVRIKSWPEACDEAAFILESRRELQSFRRLILSGYSPSAGVWYSLNYTPKSVASICCM